MKTEIGGYFELEQRVNNELYPDMIALNTGCNALLYVMKAKKVKKLYLPYFLCSCVSEMCERYGYRYEYYEIDDKFFPLFEGVLNDAEFLYVVNFYGQISNVEIERLQRKYRNIIVDNVQAFYQRSVDKVDTIYSCRKYFGVPDGAYLATDTKIEEKLVTDGSADRMKHILGRFEQSATEFYSSYRENEERCKKLELRAMSKLTHHLLGMIDYEEVRKQREANYCLLDFLLREKNGKEFRMGEGPFCYPFYFKEGKTLRKKLIEHNIYVPLLWPNVLNGAPVLERDFAENILPLPCDQRYGKEEMEFIAETIRKMM